MRARCINPNHRLFPYYGGRGISVCDSWKSFIQFYEDMREGYAEGLQLDRIDNEKGYSKDNCRWVTSKTNTRNRRSNHIVNTPQGAMVLAEAAEVYGLDPSLIRYRFRRGYSVDAVFAKVDYRSVA